MKQDRDNDAWRIEDVPRPTDSPIVVRDVDDNDRQLILTWRLGADEDAWEADGFVHRGHESGGSVVPQEVLGEEIRARRVEWVPLRDCRGGA